MKKLFIHFLTILSLCLAFSFSAFAGWKQDNIGWWYENSDGSYYADGIAAINGEWYIFNKSGYMVTGWSQAPNGDWYYAYPSGAVAKNAWIDGYYYVGSNGVMMTDTWIGEYYVGSDGKWIPGKTQGKTFAKNWIFGEYQNLTEPDYSSTRYKDLQIRYNPNGLDFGGQFALYNSTGTGNSLYNSSNPNGDSFVVGFRDGRTFDVYSYLTDDYYTLEYNGNDTIVLHWRSTSWTKKDIVLKKVWDYDLEYYYDMGSYNYGGGVG